MNERSTYGPTRVGPRRVVLVLAVAAMTLLSVACESVKLGGPGAAIGNVVDPVNCPQHQPVPYAPCGPQPLVWAAMNGPYDNYDNGDPYSTKCVQGGGSGPTCTVGNPLYRTTGFVYAIEVTAADVGRRMTLDAYDIGAYPRTVTTSSYPTYVSYDLSDVVTTSASTTITSASGRFTSADVGQRISGVFCSSSNSNCTISIVLNATTAIINSYPTMSGTFGATVGSDCNTQARPFNSPAYSGMYGGNRQTGDDVDIAGQNIDVQVYDNDGTGKASYASPLPNCHFSHSAAEMSQAITTYKNTWAPLCTFTPEATGIYSVRVRNSGITGRVDVGAGTNAYSLRVSGATSTSRYPLEDHSVFVNAVASASAIYVADVPADNAGKKLLVDLYDVGDGTGSSQAVLQLKAPPGGTSTTPALTGVTVPAAGIATSCRYNAIPSATQGPDTPDAAGSCAVITHQPAAPGNGVYNGKWLRYEVTLDPSYTCSTDCRWTLQYNWGSTGLPTDRIVFSAKVV